MGDMHDHDERFAAGEHLEEDDWNLTGSIRSFAPPPVTGKGPRPSRVRLRKPRRTALGLTRKASALFLLCATLWAFLVGTIWQAITGRTWEWFFNNMSIMMEWACSITPLVILVVVGWFGLVALFFYRVPKR